MLLSLFVELKKEILELSTISIQIYSQPSTPPSSWPLQTWQLSLRQSLQQKTPSLFWCNHQNILGWCAKNGWKFAALSLLPTLKLMYQWNSHIFILFLQRHYYAFFLHLSPPGLHNPLRWLSSSKLLDSQF